MLVNALLIDIALNPRHPTSIAWHIACQPFTRHCSTSGSYLAIFLSCVDSTFSSHGTDSSHIITFFVELENITISGRSFVSTICAGNFVCLSRSTNNCQPGADDNSVTLFFVCGCFELPALTKITLCLPGLNLIDFIASDTLRAITLRTWSCRQRQRPSLNDLAHPDSKCSNVSLHPYK